MKEEQANIAITEAKYLQLIEDFFPGTSEDISPSGYERFISIVYRECGYETKVVGGAGDYGADVIIVKGDEKIAIQAKRYNQDKVLGVKGIQEVYAAKDYYNCTGAKVICTSDFSKSAIELAEKLGVECLTNEMFKEQIIDQVRDHLSGNKVKSDLRSDDIPRNLDSDNSPQDVDPDLDLDLCDFYDAFEGKNLKTEALKSIKRFAEAGGDISSPISDDLFAYNGLTILESACMHPNMEFVKTLLDWGADASIGNPILHLFEGADHHQSDTTEILELLITAGGGGANVNMMGRYCGCRIEEFDSQLSLLDFALELSRYREAAILRKHGAKTAKWLLPQKFIHIAAETGDIEAFKQHLAKGKNSNAKDNVGCTPLHRAASGGSKEVVELLIAEGVDVNAKNDAGGTPLQMAAGEGHKEIVELLIANGADVNLKERKELTAFHIAAQNNHKEIAELLIDKGADVNAFARAIGTALHAAALGNYNEVAEMLIARGADVNAKDSRGSTPLDWAVASTRMVKLLRKHGGEGRQDNAAQRHDPKGGGGQSREEIRQAHIQAIEQKLGIKSSPDNIKY